MLDFANLVFFQLVSVSKNSFTKRPLIKSISLESLKTLILFYLD